MAFNQLPFVFYEHGLCNLNDSDKLFIGVVRTVSTNDCFTIDLFNIGLINYFDPNMLKSPFNICYKLQSVKRSKEHKKVHCSNNNMQCFW